MAGDHDHAHGPNEVWVYELVPPALIASAESIVREALFDVLGVSDAARHIVTVSPSSGWVTYFDREGVWRAEPSPSLPTATQARAKGDKFLRDLLAALDRRRTELPEELRTVAWLPQARPTEMFAIPRPDGQAFDHWLYRLVPRIAMARDRAAVDVYGATLELRLDPVGKVISYQARWRPLTGQRVSRAFKRFVPPPPPPGSKGRGGHGHDMPSALVYYQDGDGIPQVHLSPYHMVNTGHVLTAVGACDMSLVIDFVQKLGTDGIEVWGVVSGGSGRAEFSWAYRPLDDPMGEATVIGSTSGRTYEAQGAPPVAASTIQVPRGNYLVMVNVQDPATGAFKHYAEAISSLPQVKAQTLLVS